MSFSLGLTYPFSLTYAQLDARRAQLEAEGCSRELIDLADPTRHPLTYGCFTAFASTFIAVGSDRNDEYLFAARLLGGSIAALAISKLHTKGDIAAVQTVVRSYIAASSLWFATAIVEDVTGQRWIRPIIGAAAAPIFLNGAAAVANRVLAYFKRQ